MSEKEEDDIILDNINEMNNESITPQNTINDIILDKEKEIKDVLLLKINFLE